MINYLIEASVCLAAFYTCYWLSLSRLKLLNFNRAYLLATMLLSLVIPLLDFSLYELQSSISTNIPDYVSITPDTVTEQPGLTLRINPVLLVYLIGASTMAVILLLRISRVIHTIIKHPIKKFDKLWHVHVPDDRPVSSFFQYIFIPKSLNTSSAEVQSILTHERKHAFDWHSLDLIFTQLTGVFLWFNPFIHLYGKALKLQHEYIADEAVSGKCGKETYADLLVRYSLEQSGFSLTHSFTEHPVEKRLNMINHLNPTIMKKLRLLWSLPLTFSLILLLGVDQQAYSQTVSADLTQRTGPKLKGHVMDGESGKALEKVTVVVIHSHENTIVKAGGKTYYRRSGLFTNTEGDYILAMDKTDSLVIFRKQGYEDLTVPYKGQDIVNVELTKKAVPDKEGND